MEDKPIKEILQEILENQREQDKKKKKFKVPMKAKVSNKKARQGWVTVLNIKDNRNVDFERLKIDQQSVFSEGIPRIATAEETLYYKGKPLIILPSWSTKPFSPTDNYDETTKRGYAAQGHRLLLNKMESEAIKPKRTISGAVIFFVIIALIVIGYFVTQGGAS